MPANPVVINCPKGVWTQIAAATTTGTIHKLSVAPELYLQTYRLKGQPAPVGNDDATRLFSSGIVDNISNDGEIDVYVRAIGKDGKVRVDL